MTWFDKFYLAILDLIHLLSVQPHQVKKKAKQAVHKVTKQKPTPAPFKQLFGIDYAWGNPSPSSLRKAGVSFVCRYLSTPGNSKNLRTNEARALKAAGLGIVTVWETTANRAQEGSRAGGADAIAAKDQLARLAPNAPIFFAVDFESKGINVGDYFRGVKSVLPLRRIGVYGDYDVCHRLKAAGLASYGWQTYAWSGGQWGDSALQQFSNDHTIAGVSCDYDRATKPDYGQWH